MREIKTVNGPQWTEFLQFICERSQIYKRKEVLKLPREQWTKDPILAAGKFGNVWRELDAGTLYETQRLGHITDPIEQLQFILVYRHNLIPRVTEMLFGGLDAPGLVNWMNGRPIISDVIKIYPGAWSPDPLKDFRPLDWAMYVEHHYKTVKKNIQKLYNDISMAHEIYSNPNHHAIYLYDYIKDQFPQLGGFKAYEVVTSMTYLSWIPLDGDSLPHVGHGAKPMLQYLTGDYETGDTRLAEYLPMLAPLIRERLATEFTHQFDNMSDEGLYWARDNFDCRTLEDCLCEYRKYKEVESGQRVNRPYPDNLRRWE